MKKLSVLLIVSLLAVSALGYIVPQGSETWTVTWTRVDYTTTQAGVTQTDTFSDYFKPNPTQNGTIIGGDKLWTGPDYWTPTGDDLGGGVVSQVGSTAEATTPGITNRGCTPQSMEAFDGRGGVFLNLVNGNPQQQDNNRFSGLGWNYSDGINDFGEGWDLRHGYKMTNNAYTEGWVNADDGSNSKTACINPLQLQAAYGNDRYTQGMCFDSKDNGGDAGDMLVTLSGFTPGQEVLLSVIAMARDPQVEQRFEDFSWGTKADGSAVNVEIVNTHTKLFPAGSNYSDVAFACDIGTFTADGSGLIELYLGDNYDAANESGFSRTMIDGIMIVPEPMTIGLIGLGGLFLRRRK